MADTLRLLFALLFGGAGIALGLEAFGSARRGVRPADIVFVDGVLALVPILGAWWLMP